MKTPEQVYKNIYTIAKAMFLLNNKEATEDQASRHANKLAVQKTWKTYNSQLKSNYLVQSDFDNLVTQKADS